MWKWMRTRVHHVSGCGDSSFSVVAMCEICRRVTIVLAMVAHEGREIAMLLFSSGLLRN